MMLQEKLKSETAGSHTSLEQLMFVNEIMQRTLTVAQYKTILITNFAAHQQYENAIYDKLSIPTKQALELETRAKLPALQLDLKEADIQQADFEDKLSKPISNIPNEAFALGAMYVLEGATMGGSVIVKQLAKNENFNDHFSFHYYNCYHDQLMLKWKQFIQVLNSLPEENHKDAIDGANFMFKVIADTAA
ncbi:MAG: biliverdin-producing heme oxygenase [Bacteroidota bacterium]